MKVPILEHSSIAEYGVFLDIFLSSTVRDVRPIEILATLSGVDSIRVRCLCNEEWGPVVLLSTFDGAGAQGVDVEFTCSVDPFDGARVADEDLVGIELDLVLLESDHSTLLEN